VLCKLQCTQPKPKTSSRNARLPGIIVKRNSAAAQTEVAYLVRREPRTRMVHPHMTQWNDPTANTALYGVPDEQFECLVEMVEYLFRTYADEVIRSEDGKLDGSQQRAIKHGTRGGYLAEQRRGLPTYDACRAANTADYLARRKAS
jgi:hypothetical protein